jgi:crossover junction endodeoxyribonuclease RuvC
MSIYSPKIILGIDPGYDRVGVGIIKRENNKDEYIYSDCIVTDKSKDYSDRLQEIYISLNDIIKHYNPSIAVIEDLFFTTNQKTVIKVAQARGVIMLACIQNKLITQELTPLQIKMSLVGNGRAEKPQVEMMVRQILKFKLDKRLDDELDALAGALAYREEYIDKFK